MGDVKRCAACGKENPVSEMKVCMHHQMHRYVCDSKCMTDFYNPPKKPTAAELQARVAELQAELAKLRAGQGEAVGHVYTMQPCFPGEPMRAHAQLHVALPAGTKLYTNPQPSAVPAASRLDADDVRAACQNAIEVFADEENAEQCREVAEYMREVLLADLDRASAPSAPKADERPLYTCIGKGGEYRYLGTAIGAGDSRGELAEVYQDRTGQLFHRTPEDFMERMEPIAAARQEGGKV